ncbi:MAG: hypothetical protein ABSG15_13005 [FCB group bacterium]
MNILGIDNEKNKKVKYQNTLNDSYHSYYGQFCDYVISDDIGFINKTKFLYNLFDYSAQVLHVDEFIKLFSNLVIKKENDIDSFSVTLRDDLDNGIVIKQDINDKENIYKMQILTNHRYFGFFNIIEIYKQEDYKVYGFFNSRRCAQSFILKKEFISITKKIIKLFGPDKDFKNEFTDDDFTLLKKDLWKGRTWYTENLIIKLDFINKDNLFLFEIIFIN